MEDIVKLISVFNDTRGTDFTLDTTLREFIPVWMNPDVDVKLLSNAMQRNGFEGYQSDIVQGYIDEGRKLSRRMDRKAKRRENLIREGKKCISIAMSGLYEDVIKRDFETNKNTEV